MLTRTLSIMRKEFLHIIRDPRTLAVMFLIPVMQLILLGYAATTDVGHRERAKGEPVRQEGGLTFDQDAGI